MRKGIDYPLGHHVIAISAICLFCIVVYSNTLNSPFVFDDDANIRENAYIRLTDFDFQRLSDAMFESPAPNRPVANISFALNYYFGEYDVTGYHVVNIIIHLINGILVYFLALIIFKQASQVPNQKTTKIDGTLIPKISCFAALIFVAHPVQTQSVTYVVQRMNSMAVMFFFLSLLLYISGRLNRAGWRRWSLFGACFFSWIMALGSKEIAATLPFLIVLYEWYFFQDLRSDWLKRNITYIVGLIIISGLVVFIYVGESPFDKILSGYASRDFTALERVLTQFRVVVFYMSLLVFPHPVRLNVLHQISTSHSLVEPITTLFSLLIIIGLISLAIYLARKHRLISFCILWFFINLTVESSIVGLEMIFEHRLYLPMFGFVVIVSSLLCHFSSKKQLWAMVICAIITMSLATAAYVRNRVWQNGMTLWSDVLSKNSQSHRAHCNLGGALEKQGRLNEAIEYYLAALRINPAYVVAHYNLGAALDKQGRTDEAVAHYLEALRVHPRYVKAHTSLGGILDKQGRTDEAIDHYLEALRIYPRYAKAHNNLGIALGKQGRTDEAINHFLEALRIHPGFAEAHNNLGVVLFRQGNVQGAIDHFRGALRIKPDYGSPKRNLNRILMGQQQGQ